MHFTLQLPAPVFCQHFHPSRRQYVAGCIDGTIRVYNYAEDYSSFDVYVEKKETSACRIAAFNEDYLVYALRSGEAVVITVKGGVEAVRIASPGAPATSVLWLSDTLFCVGYENGQMMIYDRTYRNSLRATINEFTEPINAMALHQNLDSFYAVAGGQLGQFRIASKDHGTRLIAMSDENAEDIENLALMQEGRSIVCCSANFGLAIFSDGDIGTYKERISGLKYPIHSILKLSEEFFLIGGEAGQILVGQLCPNQLIGLFAELHGEPEDSEAIEELSDEDANTLIAIDSMAADSRGELVAILDNSMSHVIFKSLKPAREVCEGTSIGKKTAYADFMDEL